MRYGMNDGNQHNEGLKGKQERCQLNNNSLEFAFTNFKPPRDGISRLKLIRENVSFPSPSPQRA